MPTSIRPAPAIPTASMSDIAFLLLVFFLLVSAFREDVGLPAGLPPVTERVQPVRSLLTVQVAASGALAVEGETMAPEAVREAVAAFAAGGGPVEVKAHRSAPYAAYAAAVDAVLMGHRDAGAEPRLALSQPNP